MENGFSFLKYKRACDLHMSLFIIRGQFKPANTLRLLNFLHSVKTPNSPTFKTTPHNEARFRMNRIKPIPSRMKARPKQTAREQEIKKAFIALKYGSKYKTLSLVRKSELMTKINSSDLKPVFTKEQILELNELINSL